MEDDKLYFGKSPVQPQKPDSFKIRLQAVTASHRRPLPFAQADRDQARNAEPQGCRHCR